MQHVKGGSSPRSGRLRVGFHLPGILAAAISKSVEDRRPRNKVVRDLLNLQRDFWVTCPQCHTKTSPLEIWDRKHLLALWELAQVSSYMTLLREVKRQFEAYLFACPDCGSKGSLRDNTVGLPVGRGLAVGDRANHASVASSAEAEEGPVHGAASTQPDSEGHRTA